MYKLLHGGYRKTFFEFILYLKVRITKTKYSTVCVLKKKKKEYNENRLYISTERAR